MTVVNHLSFIGTPLEVEEFRLMCRAKGVDSVAPFSFAGLVPARSIDSERVAKWGCYRDAAPTDPRHCYPVPESTTLTQYTVEFETEGAAPHQWLRAVMRRWPQGHVTLVSTCCNHDKVLVYIREPSGDIGARVYSAEDTEAFDDEEEWEDA